MMRLGFRLTLRILRSQRRREANPFRKLLEAHPSIKAATGRLWLNHLIYRPVASVIGDLTCWYLLIEDQQGHDAARNLLNDYFLNAKPSGQCFAFGYSELSRRDPISSMAFHLSRSQRCRIRANAMSTWHTSEITGVLSGTLRSQQRRTFREWSTMKPPPGSSSRG